jgi:hypothetical protein
VELVPEISVFPVCQIKNVVKPHAATYGKRENSLGGRQMTTGMKTESNVETRKRRFNRNWLWLVLAAIVALALIGYATTPKPPRAEDAATSGSVQDSATGQQGSVGLFAEQVIPNEEGTTTGGPRNMPPGMNPPATGQGVPGAETEWRGTDAGAGSTGIPSTLEGESGATPHGQSQSGTSRGSVDSDHTGPSIP